MITSHTRGREIYYDEALGKWFFLDTMEEANDERSCIKCGRKPSPEGYDACTGFIKSAKSVCCGHGVGKTILRMKNEVLCLQ